jgi:mono/diheme cytochrome c family protein
MKRNVVLFLIAAVPQIASAQPFPAGDTLNPTQKLGRDLFMQHCIVCHVGEQITSAGHFGPAVSGQSLGGKENVIAEIIGNGTPNMPGFKYVFDPQQIRAIAAYVKSLPAPAPEAPRAEKPTPGKQSDD